MASKVGRTCSVCTDDRVNAINAALLLVDGETVSVRGVALDYGVGYQAVLRHYKNHLEPTVKAIVAQELVAEGEVIQPLPDTAPKAIGALKYDIARGMTRSLALLDETVVVGEEVLTAARGGARGQPKDTEATLMLMGSADFAGKQADRSLRGINGTITSKAIAMIAQDVEDRIENSREERLLAYLLDEDDNDE